MKYTITILIMLCLASVVFADVVSGPMPLHGGYSYLGYCSAGRIFTMLNKTGIYVAVGLLGIIGSIWFCLTKTPGRLTAFYIYVGTVFFIFAVLVPRRTVPIIKSHAEAKGANVAYTAAEFAEQKGVTGGEVPRGLFWLNQGLDKIAALITDALDSLATKKGHGLYSSNFSYLWASILSQDMGISNNKLRVRFNEFCKQYYGPALTDYSNHYDVSKESVSFPYWPGDARLKEFYPENGWNVWGNLRDDMYNYAREGDLGVGFDIILARSKKIFRGLTKTQSRDMGIYTAEDMVLQQMFLDTEVSSTAKAQKAAEGKSFFARSGSFLNTILGKPQREVVAKGLVWGISQLLAPFYAAVINAVPVIQAMSIYFALALFPVVILVCLLPFPGHQVRILSTYILSLFWLHSWSWGIVIGNAFNQISWQTNSIMADGMINFISALFVITSPAITYMLIIQGSMGAVNSMSAAVGGLAGASAGMAQGAAVVAK